MRATLSAFPDVNALQRRAQSLAVLDAILSPDWQYRYYAFNSKWDANELMASRKNGSGDELYILFNTAGAIIKGFDHESFMSPWARDDQSLWPRLFDEVPAVFGQFLKEPAFDIPDTTFCIWRQHTDVSWNIGKIEYPDGDEKSDGSEEQLSLYSGGPELYSQFAKDYFEQELPIEMVIRIYDHQPVTQDVVKKLNPETSLEVLEAELLEIGYPSK